MNSVITVDELIEKLQQYDGDTVVKFGQAKKFNNTTIALDFLFITESTVEVYGKEIVIHPANDNPAYGDLT